MPPAGDFFVIYRRVLKVFLREFGPGEVDYFFSENIPVLKIQTLNKKIKLKTFGTTQHMGTNQTVSVGEM